MQMVSSLFSGVPPLFVALAKSISGDIDCTKRTIEEYSKDGSPYTVIPRAIIYPKNATDIKYTIAFSREYSMPLTVRGGGTSKNGGVLGEGIILDMSRYFTHVKQINMMEHTITVDAGVTIKNLREKLHGWNVDVPVLTSSDELSTIGGLLATKSSTPSSFHNGTIREWVESLSVVVDTGEEHRIADGITPSGRLLGIYQSVFPILSEGGPIIRANKPENNDDSTGYSVWNTSIGPRQLIDELVGSEGTLGIITSVTLRLSPHKKHSATSFIPINETSLLTTCIDIAKHHNAEHIFLYDSTFKKLTDEYHNNLLPKTLDAPYTLLVTHKDTDREKVHLKTKSFIRALPVKEDSIIYTENFATIEHVSSNPFVFSIFKNYTKDKLKIITTGNGLIIPTHVYATCLHEIDEYLSGTEKPYIITGNAGSGHINITIGLESEKMIKQESINSFNEKIFSIIKKYKGGISAVGGDGLSRTPYLGYVYNDATKEIFKKIKEAWDERHIFNPGKKISTSTDYLSKHIDNSN